MREQYENPPLVEAACRFHFRSEQPWNASIVEQFHSRLAEVYPTKEQANAEDEEIGEEMGVAEVTLLQRADRRGHLSLGPHMLTVRRLQPYEGWDAFRATIMQALNAYRDAAQDHDLQNVALRYLNYIELPVEGVALETFTNIRIGLPKTALESEDRVVNGWFQDVSIILRNANAILKVNSGLVPPTEDVPPFFALDLQCRPLEEGELSFDKILDWLDVAHETIERMFEASITEQVRTGFGKEQDESDS